MKIQRRLAAVLSAAAVGLGGGLVAAALAPSPAEAHGAQMFPGSRQFLCWEHGTELGQQQGTGGLPVFDNPACQSVVNQAGLNWFWNWFGNLHPSNNGGTVGSIPDGRICDGSDAGPFDFSPFNQARGDWPRTHLTAGATYEFQHNNWAAHPGRFDTYITVQGWNPGTPLSWNELQLVHSTADDLPVVPQTGGPGGLEFYFWDVTMPTNRSGNHIIFVHWVRNDSPENFFSCSDVAFDGGNGEVTIPGGGGPQPPPPPPPCDDPNEPASTPGPAIISGITQTSAEASWGPSSGCATAYELVNVAGGVEEVVLETTGMPAPFVGSITGLEPDTSYAVAVRARNDNIGQVTDLTDAAPFTTLGDEPPPPPPPPGDCTVSYDAINDWGAGFQAEVTVTNNSGAPVSGWDVTWTFPSGQGITQLWNGTPTSQPGPDITVSNAPWNNTIGANGGSVNFGFLGSPGGGNDPTAFALNGTACNVS